MKKKETEYNSEITTDDLQALGDKAGNLRNDNGDDELLKSKVNEPDFIGKDLDVPGRKMPKSRSKNSLKDEENQLYSLGSDDNENLEIDTIN
jgi:hypothetical protein